MRKINDKGKHFLEAMSNFLTMKYMNSDKKGQIALLTGLVAGIAGLIILIVIYFVYIQTIVNANLLTDASLEDNATDRLRGNFSQGIDNISGKIPTILLIGAVVILIGALFILVELARRRGGGGANL